MANKTQYRPDRTKTERTIPEYHREESPAVYHQQDPWQELRGYQARFAYGNSCGRTGAWKWLPWMVGIGGAGLLLLGGFGGFFFFPLLFAFGAVPIWRMVNCHSWSINKSIAENKSSDSSGKTDHRN